MDVNRCKGLMLGFGATCFWGSFYPVSRYLFGEAAGELDAFSVSFLRFALAGIVLLPFVLRRSNGGLVKKAVAKDWKLLLFLALIGIVGEGVLVFVANKYTTAGRCTLLTNASPIFTVLFAYFLTREVLTGRKITGMLIGFAGIALIILAKKGSDVYGTGDYALLGDLMALGAGVCWSLYTVLGERIARDYGGVLCTALLFVLGTLMMIPVMLIAGSSWDFHFSWKVWLGIAYLGVLTNGLANGMWYAALKYLKAGELGAFGYLSAFLAITISAIVLEERLGWPFFAAAGLVFGGVYFMMKRPAAAASERGGGEDYRKRSECFAEFSPERGCKKQKRRQIIG